MADALHEHILHLGEIPWTFEDLSEALAELVRLHATPHDDWSRTPEVRSWEQSDGSIAHVAFNPDMIDNQIAGWLVRRFRSQQLDDEARRAHLWRFFEVQAFFMDHLERLKREGLMTEDGEGIEIEEELLRVLAVARYEGARAQGPEGEAGPSFEIESVIRAAQALRDTPPATEK